MRFGGAKKSPAGLRRGSVGESPKKGSRSGRLARIAEPKAEQPTDHRDLKQPSCQVAQHGICVIPGAATTSAGRSTGNLEGAR